MRSKSPSILYLFSVVVGVALSSHLEGQTAKTALDEHATAAAAAVKLQDTANEYVIGPDDVLSVNVWKEPEISRSLPVRPDGNISLPLVGDLMASGHTPVQLQSEIRQQLVTYLSNPEVTVVVQEAKSHRFNIVGEVDKPGSYVMSSPMTVLDAIALAGGLRDFARETKIYVLRVNADGSRVRLPFNYKRVIRGSDLKADVQLEPRDTIVVP
jgi:polysaccharide export outer membrane protein